MARDDDPATFYHANATPLRFDPPETVSVATPVCVIGGGLAGLHVARALAFARIPVVLLEAQRVGHGASGRNGGFVSPGYALSMRDIEEQVGLEQAKELYDLSVEGFETVKSDLRHFGLRRLVHGEGYLTVQRHADVDELRWHAEHMNETYGTEKEFLRREQVYGYLRTLSYHAGLLDPAPFHIDPYYYTRVLARDARDAGVDIYEQTPVFSITRQDWKWRIDTIRGEVMAEQVVLAGSAYQRGVFRALDRAVIPVSTHVVTTAPLSSRERDAIRFNGCIADTRRASDYYRLVPSPEGRRLLWGGRISTFKPSPNSLAKRMHGDLTSVFPQLQSVAIDHAWTGLMAYTRTKMPLVGPLDDGVWACTGFGGHGLNTTAACAHLVAGAVVYGDDRWRLFEPFQTRWGGGLLGKAGAQIAYWKMQFDDRVRERRPAPINDEK
ncbi:MAG: FAD-binding oxidoreductase [Pseudomonadota bacterium]